MSGIRSVNHASCLDELMECWDEALNDEVSCHKFRQAVINSQWSRLSGLAELTTNLDTQGVSLRSWLFFKLKTLCNGSKETEKYRIEADPDNVYTLVQQILDSTILSGNNSAEYIIASPLDSSQLAIIESALGYQTPESKLVTLSAKLWLRMVVRMEAKDLVCTDDIMQFNEWCIKDEITQSFHLLRQYLAEPLEGSGSPHVIRIISEEHCRSVLQLLLNGHISGRKLSQLLAKVSVKTFLWDPNKPISTFVSQRKSRYYIISTTTEAVVIYDEELLKLSKKEYLPAILKQGLTQTGVTICDIAGSEQGWEYIQVKRNLKKHIDEKAQVVEERRQKLGDFAHDSSMMFVASFYTRGVQGHVMDSAKRFAAYTDILEVMNSRKELKHMPKVLIIQSCAGGIDEIYSNLQPTPELEALTITEDILYQTKLQEYMDKHTSSTTLLISNSSGEQSAGGAVWSLLGEFTALISQRHGRITEYLNGQLKLARLSHMNTTTVISTISKHQDRKPNMPNALVSNKVIKSYGAMFDSGKGHTVKEDTLTNSADDLGTSLKSREGEGWKTDEEGVHSVVWRSREDAHKQERNDTKKLDSAERLAVVEDNLEHREEKYIVSEMLVRQMNQLRREGDSVLDELRQAYQQEVEMDRLARLMLKNEMLRKADELRKREEVLEKKEDELKLRYLKLEEVISDESLLREAKKSAEPKEVKPIAEDVVASKYKDQEANRSYALELVLPKENKVRLTTVEAEVIVNGVNTGEKSVKVANDMNEEFAETDGCVDTVQEGIITEEKVQEQQGILFDIATDVIGGAVELIVEEIRDRMDDGDVEDVEDDYDIEDEQFIDEVDANSNITRIIDKEQLRLKEERVNAEARRIRRRVEKEKRIRRRSSRRRVPWCTIL